MMEAAVLLVVAAGSMVIGYFTGRQRGYADCPLRVGQGPDRFVSDEAAQWAEDAADYPFDHPGTLWPEGLTWDACYWAWRAASLSEAFDSGAIPLRALQGQLWVADAAEAQREEFRR